MLSARFCKSQCSHLVGYLSIEILVGSLLVFKDLNLKSFWLGSYFPTYHVLCLSIFLIYLICLDFGAPQFVASGEETFTSGSGTFILWAASPLASFSSIQEGKYTCTITINKNNTGFASTEPLIDFAS